MDGWSGSVGPTYDDYAKDTCGEGGALTAALGDVSEHVADVDVASWTFSTPVTDTMKAATMWRAADADGGAAVNADYETWLSGPSKNGVFDQCVFAYGCPTGVGDPGQPLAAGNRVSVPPTNLGGHLYINAACEGDEGFKCPSSQGDAKGYAAAVNLYAADIVLEQTAGPSATNVSGELATAPTVTGTSDLIFSASDPGAGVWEATFSIDGKLVQSTAPNENGGRCRNVGQSTDGLPAFLYLQPCLASESVDVGFNTTAVSNGEHHLVVSVVDPAGNAAPVLDRQINVANPVPGAGPAGPGPVAKVRRVRARLTLKVKPRRLSIKRSIHFSGRLEGGSIPKGGKLLVVEARRHRGGRWSKFDITRTDASGKYHGSYDFKFLGPGHYQLRVLCEGEALYPFATGWSNVVGVRVS